MAESDTAAIVAGVCAMAARFADRLELDGVEACNFALLARYRLDRYVVVTLEHSARWEWGEWRWGREERLEELKP